MPPIETRDDPGHRATRVAFQVTVEHALKNIPILGPGFDYLWDLIKKVAAELGISPAELVKRLIPLTAAEKNAVVTEVLSSPEGREKTARLTDEQLKILRRQLMGIPVEFVEIMSRIEANEAKTRRDREEAEAEAARQKAAESQAKADAEYPRLEKELKRLMEAGSWYSAFEILEQMEAYRPRGIDLRLMSPLNDVGSIPTEGKSLIIVAAVNNVLHFRIFDGDGKAVEDTDEERLTKQHRQIKDLKKQLESLWPPHVLTRSEKGWVIPDVSSIVGQPRASPHREYRDFVEMRITRYPPTLGVIGWLVLGLLYVTLFVTFGMPMEGFVILLHVLIVGIGGTWLFGWLVPSLIWDVLPKFLRRPLIRLANAINRLIGINSGLRCD